MNNSVFNLFFSKDRNVCQIWGVAHLTAEEDGVSSNFKTGQSIDLILSLSCALRTVVSAL